MVFAKKNGNSIHIFGFAMKHLNDFFDYPYSSHKTDIFISNGENYAMCSYELKEIKAKMVCLSYKDEFVFIPLLHSLDELA